MCLLILISLSQFTLEPSICNALAGTSCAVLTEKAMVATGLRLILMFRGRSRTIGRSEDAGKAKSLYKVQLCPDKFGRPGSPGKLAAASS